MKKGLLPKIVAMLALLGIFIGIIGTTVLYILSPKEDTKTDKSVQNIKMTPEQLKQLEEITKTNVSSGAKDVKK